MAFAHRTYSAESKFKAGKPFTMNGVSYNYDDPVDVSGIEPRRLRLMFDARLLEVDESGRAPAKRHPLDHDGDGRKGGSVKGRKAKAEEEPAATASGHKLKNGGFGRWYITTADGENVAGPFEGEGAKAKAEATLARMQ